MAKTTGESLPRLANAGRRPALLQRHPWLTFILPLAIYMLAGSFEPTSPEKPGGASIGLAIPYTYYPLVYTLKIAIAVAAICFVLPGYREFPLRITLLALIVGVVGVVLWVALCRLGLEQKYLVPLLAKVHLDWLIASGERSAFDPLTELAGHPARAWGFLLIRFFGLVAVVPVIEEFFYRGFLMRSPVQHDWWNVPAGKVDTAGVVLATIVPMAMHPAELLAAAVWFSLVTWLYVRTRSVWDCVIAHATTNLLLGIYVATSGNWQLM